MPAEIGKKWKKTENEKIKDEKDEKNDDKKRGTCYKFGKSVGNDIKKITDWLTDF